jgi:hypothetical protein
MPKNRLDPSSSSTFFTSSNEDPLTARKQKLESDLAHINLQISDNEQHSEGLKEQLGAYKVGNNVIASLAKYSVIDAKRSGEIQEYACL